MTEQEAFATVPWGPGLERMRAGRPVTPSRPYRIRVDTGPVGYLWLEWLGACARIVGISNDETWAAEQRWQGRRSGMSSLPT